MGSVVVWSVGESFDLVEFEPLTREQLDFIPESHRHCLCDFRLPRLPGVKQRVIAIASKVSASMILPQFGF